MTSRLPLPLARALQLAACVCAAASSVAIPDAAARTLQEVKALGAISMCANPDALPYSSERPDLPGFQIEIGRAIAQRLGVSLNVDWVVPRRRVAEVNCDMLLDQSQRPSAPKAEPAALDSLSNNGRRARTWQKRAASTASAISTKHRRSV